MDYYELETTQYFPNSEKNLSTERNFIYIKSFLFAIDRLIAVPKAQGDQWVLCNLYLEFVT